MSNDERFATPVWTILNLLQWTTDFLKKNGIDNPRPDAEILLAHALKCDRIDLYLHHDQPLQVEELSQFKPLIKRRALHEPVAYIRGMKEFWSLEFKVTPDVLIPRPETEGLVELALQYDPENDPCRVLELGTGSGIISVTMAHERPHWKFWASDISANAIDIARLNACKQLQADRIAFMVGRWFDAIGDKGNFFDLIVSNPPYISRDDLSRLEPDISQYEPIQALDGGPDGLDSISVIIKTASRYMKSGGWLILEIGYDQGASVQILGQTCGDYDHMTIEKDLSGHDRLALFRKK
jgi:release factor glutamine methyltransferase